MSGIRDRHRVPRTHRTSLRRSLALPILIASLALTALWGYAGNALLRDSLQLRDDADFAESLGVPTHLLVSRLQDERRLTAQWQADPTDATRAELETAQGTTDAAIDAFLASAALDGSALQSRANRLTTALEDLPQRREVIDAEDITATEAFRGYTETTGDAIALLGAAADHADDGRLAHGGAAAASVAQLAETLSRQDTLVTLATVAPDDEAAAAVVREEFAQALALQRQARTTLTSGDLPEETAGNYEALTGSPRWAALVSAEDPGATTTTTLPEEDDAWRDAVHGVSSELRQLSSDALRGATADGSDRAGRLLLTAIIGTAVALAALAAIILLGTRLTRSLVGRLTQLEERTTQQADIVLPQLLERLAENDETDPANRPPDRYYGADEVGRLAGAMQHQWQLVEDTIVRQTRGREGTETVFLGLARRTQVLINRMIPKLDKLEREHQDSRLLKDIFGVDHLATRVRRHTENLLILGGALPARRWGKPVPIYEVMRSAISETEDYSRVEAVPAPQVSLVGRAVADVVHLLSELIENGTSFSPPETKVAVSADVVARGRVALEVVDRGLGMSEEEYERVNRLLADPPRLDVMALGEAPRLGLFVVARLAKRHHLEVSLRKSPYGGTLAVVLLPSELLEESKSLLSGIISEAAEAQSARQTPPAKQTPPPPALDDEAPSPQAWEPAAAVPNGVADLPDPESQSDYDHSGYPAYGGAGLLPNNTPGTPEARAEDTTLSARSHPSVDRTVEEEDLPPVRSAGLIPPAQPSQPSQPDQPTQPAEANTTSLRLPTRVRGESLAEQLRIERQTLAGQGDAPADAPSPDRAGAIMAAIQSGNKRARTAKPAQPDDGDADAEGPARKDQR
jgi:signal transduction histidine kinase